MANRNVPLVWGVIGIGGGVFLAISGGVIGIIIASFLIIFGWVSLKSAVFGKDKEIEELTGQRPVSNETKNDFASRM
jgi:hypothetical protein